MHGEYKPPSGELVAADVEVAAGRLAKVQISGNFFLELDGALTPDAVTRGELRAARDLARARFGRSEWTARVP